MKEEIKRDLLKAIFGHDKNGAKALNYSRWSIGLQICTIALVSFHAISGGVH